MSDLPTPTPGVKLHYLIKGRPTTSREELVAHWYANHMPAVIAGQHKAAAAGKLHAHRYVVTLFDADRDGNRVWDGVAQLWWSEAPPRPAQPHGTVPADSFQERAETYVPWVTTEYVVIDGSERLPVQPLTLNPAFPCTRSGFLKVTFLVKAKPDADLDAFLEHWRSVHIANVREVMGRVGGFRYVVNHSVDPASEPYAGMAELYFDDLDGWRAFRDTIEPDGMERFSDPNGTVVQQARTQFIGIP